MAYTTPFTAVSNSVYTAAQHNASVRDNILETPAAKATVAGSIFVATGANAIAERIPTTNSVTTTETTASTTYVDLTTAGPSVSVVTGTKAIVFITAGMAQNTLGGYANVSVAVSGATTVVAGTQSVLNFRSGAASQQIVCTNAYIHTGLNAGTNTFKLQYNAGSGGGIATFFNRQIVVIPL